MEIWKDTWISLQMAQPPQSEAFDDTEAVQCPLARIGPAPAPHRGNAENFPIASRREADMINIENQNQPLASHDEGIKQMEPMRGGGLCVAMRSICSSRIFGGPWQARLQLRGWMHSGIPLGMRFCDRGIRGCRCAQPPATVWHPFGMAFGLRRVQGE